MKKIICLLLILMFSVSLFACADNEKTVDNFTAYEGDSPIYTNPDENTDWDKMLCIYSFEGGEELYLRGEKAKLIYDFVVCSTYIVAQHEVQTEEKYITLTFRNMGENDMGVYPMDSNYCVMYWIYENDYAVFTASPYTSLQTYYDLPHGTYDKLYIMLRENKGEKLCFEPEDFDFLIPGESTDMDNVEMYTTATVD